MDISNTLTFLTRKLLRRSLSVVVATGCTSWGGSTFFSVTMLVQINGKPMKAGGVASNLAEAYLKALSELGEILVIFEKKIESRNGISGGLFSVNAKERARNELVERDAFLFHYRSRTPFLNKRSIGELSAFELCSIEKGTYVVLVTDFKTAISSDCLRFGVAADSRLDVATAKAFLECLMIISSHSLSPNWCKTLGEKTDLDVLQRHHLASRDPRNLEIFEALCKCVPGSVRQLIYDDGWQYQRLKSPIRGLVYWRATHGFVTEMTFGAIEPGIVSDDGPMLHPFW